MRRLAFSASIFGVIGVLVACGGANSTDLFSGSGGGGSNGDGGGNNTSDGGNSGFGDDGGGTTGNDGGGITPGMDGGTQGKDSGTTGKTCTVDGGGTSNTCAQDEVCVSPNCSTGLCQKITVGSNDFNPVCGCDTVNYWNGATASSFAAAVKSTGACATPATCNGVQGNGKCAALGAADCAYERPDVGGAACGATVKGGVCWGMPNSCPNKPTSGVSLCNNGNCADLCSTIKNQSSYRVTVPACKIM